MLQTLRASTKHYIYTAIVECHERSRGGWAKKETKEETRGAAAFESWKRWKRWKRCAARGASAATDLVILMFARLNYPFL